MIKDANASMLGRSPGLPEEYFVTDGLITKRAVRAIALAQLRPNPGAKGSGEMLWDLGTGSGSIGVEWCRVHPAMRAVGVERNPERLANARVNAENLTLPGQFEVLEGKIADRLDELSDPDAVFIGGGATADVIERAIARLGGRGRIVVHGVTLETEMLLGAQYAERGGELSRIGVENAEKLGSLSGFVAARPITCWTLWLD